jgi:hypothetical protein
MAALQKRRRAFLFFRTSTSSAVMRDCDKTVFF